MSEAEWIGADELAGLAAISPQAARKALKQHSWRGGGLTVRMLPGRGGRSGLRYEVSVASLPDDLQLRHRQSLAAELDLSILRSDEAAAEWRTWWGATLGPALAHRKGTKARAAAIEAIAGRMHVTPNGLTKHFNKRSIQRWLTRFERDGAAGLQKHARRDRGQKRVAISARWDKAVPFDDDARDRIAGAVRAKVRSLWRSGAALSMVLRYGSEELLKLTHDEGFDASWRQLRDVCELPRAFVAGERHYRKAHQLERDRKAFEDTKPRVRRTRAGLEPSQLVVGDVHHLDIYVRRDDGRLATPKMVGWLDFATLRFFGTVFLPEVNPATNRSRSMTNAHVIVSFIDMVKAWGFPAMLYLDNGSEYNFADFIDDALKLSGDGFRIVDRASAIVRAKPYNAPAKVIEGIFGVLERGYFSGIPGWIGGDRMASKVANVGRAPEPFSGSLKDLDDAIQAMIAVYNTERQRRADTSPNEHFAKAVATGWQRTEVDPFALRVAFSTTETRRVVQGAVSVGGRYWTCPELQAFTGDKVSVLIPKYEDWSFLPLKDEAGRWLGNAIEDRPFAALDPEGAREADRRSRRAVAALRQLGAAVPRIDLVGEAIASVALAPPVPQAPTGAVVSLAADHAAIGRALIEGNEAREGRRQDKVDRDQAARLALIDKRRRAVNRG